MLWKKKNIPTNFMIVHVYGVCFNCKIKGSQGILLEMISEPRQELFYLIHIEEAI